MPLPVLLNEVELPSLLPNDADPDVSLSL